MFVRARVDKSVATHTEFVIESLATFNLANDWISRTWVDAVRSLSDCIFSMEIFSGSLNLACSIVIKECHLIAILPASVVWKNSIWFFNWRHMPSPVHGISLDFKADDLKSMNWIFFSLFFLRFIQPAVSSSIPFHIEFEVTFSILFFMTHVRWLPIT